MTPRRQHEVEPLARARGRASGSRSACGSPGLATLLQVIEFSARRRRLNSPPTLYSGMFTLGVHTHGTRQPVIIIYAVVRVRALGL